MAKSIRAILAGYTLPGGYTAELAGGYAEMMENFSDLGLALIVSVGLVYFVLASQFESFVMPVIIMMILPSPLPARSSRCRSQARTFR